MNPISLCFTSTLMKFAIALHTQSSPVFDREGWSSKEYVYPIPSHNTDCMLATQINQAPCPRTRLCIKELDLAGIQDVLSLGANKLSNLKEDPHFSRRPPAICGKLHQVGWMQELQNNLFLRHSCFIANPGVFLQTDCSEPSKDRTAPSKFEMTNIQPV